MKPWSKIEEIGRRTLESFHGMTPEDINNGDCSTFVKRMAAELDNEGIEYEVRVTRNFDLIDELEGFSVTECEYSDLSMSHCYIAIDGFGFDAFNPDGIEEREMDFLTKLY